MVVPTSLSRLLRGPEIKLSGEERAANTCSIKWWLSFTPVTPVGHGDGHGDKPLSPPASHTKMNSSPVLCLLVYSSEGYRPGLLREEATLYMTRYLLKQGLLVTQAAEMPVSRPNPSPSLAQNQQETLGQLLNLM